MSDIREQYLNALKMEQEGKLEEALAEFTRLATLFPQESYSRIHAGNILLRLQRAEEATPIAFQAIKSEPKNEEANFLYAKCLWENGDREKAIRHLLFTSQIAPDTDFIHQNLGFWYWETGKMDKAINHLSTAITLTPTDVRTRNELARAYHYTGQVDQARMQYEHIIKLEPKNAAAHFCLGTIQLSCGNLKEGWANYFWRHKYQAPHFKAFNTQYQQWLGQPLKDKTVLVTWEQGIGDTIHFSRYVLSLIEMGAYIIFDMRVLMLDLFEHLPDRYKDHITIHNTETPQPDADYFVSVMDIPAIATNVNIALPEILPPYLHTAPLLKNLFKEALKDLKGLKVGLSWQGNPNYPRDSVRSLPLDAFEFLAQIDGIDLISIQAIHGTDQLKTFKGNILDLEPLILEGDEGLSRLAGAVEAVDLVICCDSAIAHLAGAMNKPVWMMIPYVPDWRWTWHGATTALYPSMKIIRAHKGQDWYGVMERERTSFNDLVNHQKS